MNEGAWDFRICFFLFFSFVKSNFVVDLAILRVFILAQTLKGYIEFHSIENVCICI